MSKNVKKVPKTAQYIPFRCSEEMAAAIGRIADSEGKTRSEVIRSLCEKGLVAGGYTSGVQEINATVKEALIEVLQPSVERLASISAKTAHIAAAAFFLEVATNRLFTSEPEQIDAIAAKARRLGIEYLKLKKDQDLDDWLQQAIGRI